MEEKCIKLIRASAGAGKTHYLTQQYIDLLLSGDENSYRHILAVTFTNKATDEMKSRVLQELYKIASDNGDPRHDKAKSRLTAILHDYSGFSISTIDRFFQTVMRAFAREIGQYASYKVELDMDSVISQAVDRMLDSLEEPQNNDLLEWLKEFSLHQIENGKGWNITGLLYDMSKLFFREDFKLKIQENPAMVNDRQAIRVFSSEMKSITSSFKSSLRDVAKECRKACEGAGLDFKSFKGKSRSPFTVFEKWEKGEMKAPAAYEKFEESLASNRVPGLMDAVSRGIDIFQKGYERYCSASVIGNNLYLLGIYSDIFRNINEYLAENNTVLLSQTTDLLSRIIDGNDTPFVYEKIGARYEHLLLDESQDTSILQWRNFKPLFIESRSQGFRNLIVGDIKQSIYRWRGSDWRLISEYAKRDLGEEYVDDSESLDDNWRSLSNIVEFNNSIFSSIGKSLSNENAGIGGAVGRIYDNCIQSLPKQHESCPGGRVKVGFIDSADDWMEESLGRMYSDIQEFHAKGYPYGSITVLVRRNSEGARVADFLIDKGIGVVTEDSLLIGASACTSKMVAVLNYLSSPQVPVNKLLVEDCLDALDGFAITGSLYDTCEKIIRGGFFEVTEDQVPFVMAFMDSVISYQEKYGSSLSGFVKWWNETGCRKSICAPSGQDAVRVMTVHKSKGLSLEVVIVPFLEEKFVKSGSLIPTIWCSTSGIFAPLGLVPLKAVKELESTIFSAQYKEEVLYGYIDCINTAYVALTRAKSQLVVYSPAPASKDKYNINSFAAYLFSRLSDSLDEDGCVEFGVIEPFDTVSENGNDLKMSGYVSVPLDGRLALSLRSADYFDQKTDVRLRGIELHDILARVNRVSELESACASDPQTFAYLSERFNDVPAEWFDGTYESLNENSIVDSDGNMQRPDRVLLDRSKGKAVIIDYKFGEKRKSYRGQVKSYCDLIRRMGFSDVTGYLWYVDSRMVEMV
ncbi:MAG: UvrD-helicase domain-containing protein [Bacteroidales bacterium]|nr:UvrD-helicase domain-containing protein [Candidatus Cacconaster merdequi]